MKVPTYAIEQTPSGSWIVVYKGICRVGQLHDTREAAQAALERLQARFGDS